MARSFALGGLLVLVVSAPAAAKRGAITGELSAPGYTVLALSAKGKVKSDRAGGGEFKLRPPAETASLHLRAEDGTYAGPIVVDEKKKGRRAVTGVSSGARLGPVSLDIAEGFAEASRALPRKSVDGDLYAQARRGVPIGAGVFGQVRSKGRSGKVPGDSDIDGVPNDLDIDDDGDLVLDTLDRSRRKRAALGTGRVPYGLSGGLDPFDLASGMGVPLERTANINAGSTDAEIATVLPEFGYLLMSAPEQGTAELDCGGSNQVPPRPVGLPYCSAGGTGTVKTGGPPPGPEFPECCDGDGDGFGALERRFVNVGPDFLSFGLSHGANASEIRAGDVLILRLDDGTGLTDVHDFIFATTPALDSFVDEAGIRTTVSYPVTPGAPGTQQNGFPVADGPDAGSDVEITITQWPPQRRPTSENECVPPDEPPCTPPPWIDVGGLDYTVSPFIPDANDATWCGQDAFTVNDPLVAGFPDPQGGGFRDTATDRPADPSNTITYKLNLTRCLDRYGLSFNPGQTRTFRLEAFTPIVGGGSAGVDNTTQFVSFTRQ